MRFILLLPVAFSITMIPQHQAVAQDSLKYHVGVGISIEPALFGQYVGYSQDSYYFTQTPVYSPTSPYCIYVPIYAAPRIRVEPRFSIYWLRDETSPGNNTGQSDYSELTVTHFGIAVEYIIPLHEKFQLYAGPRGALNFRYSKHTQAGYTTNYTTRQSEVDQVFSGVFGGEYFPISELSVGAEVDVSFAYAGRPKYEVTPQPEYVYASNSRVDRLVATQGLFFLRWYFL